MKPRTRTAAFLLVCLAVTSPVFTQVTKVDQLKYPPLAEFKIPQPTRVALDNGLVLMLLEDHELPLVTASVRVHTGSRLEPADKIGLASLTGTVMRTGGTKTRSGDQLDDYLEGKAAVIETFIGGETGGASMNCLKKDFAELLPVLSDVLRNPVFNEEKIKVAKNQVIAGISRQNDDPQDIMFREFDQVVYGETSPYARIATYATVNSITRDDMVQWHARYFHADGTIIGLVGDFDTDQAVALVKQVFGDWEKGPGVEKVDVPFLTETPTGVFQVEKNDVNQSNIIMGHLGIRRENPDFFAVELLNQVLSGGFASRLFSNIRSRKGLAYAVSGGIGSDWDHPGTFNMWMTTKTETTGAAIDSLIEEARNLTAQPPSEEEVKKAKEAILNSFIFNSDSPEKILRQQITYEYYDYPLDWLAKYREGIEKATVGQVRAAAGKYVHPAEFAVLVVGPAQGLDKPLSSFGQVTKLDITIPEPVAEKVPEATPESRQRGDELIQKAVEALGGAAVDAVRSLRELSSVTAKTPQGEVNIKSVMTIAFPDRYIQEVTLPFGTITTVFTPDEAFMKTPAGVRAVPDSMQDELKKTLERDLLGLLKSRKDPGFSASVVGQDQVEAHPVELVRVEIGGDPVTLGIEPGTGRVLRMAYRGSDLTGTRGDLVITFSDFRQAQSLTLPFASVTTFNGEPSMTAKTESFAVDVPIDPAMFAKP